MNSLLKIRGLGWSEYILFIGNIFLIIGMGGGLLVMHCRPQVFDWSAWSLPGHSGSIMFHSCMRALVRVCQCIAALPQVLPRSTPRAAPGSAVALLRHGGQHRSAGAGRSQRPLLKILMENLGR